MIFGMTWKKMSKDLLLILQNLIWFQFCCLPESTTFCFHFLPFQVLSRTLQEELSLNYYLPRTSANLLGMMLCLQTVEQPALNCLTTFHKTCPNLDGIHC
eukprot:NODE_180_length_15790_cov_0.586706.p13 type:complete len:100 gc:universal NODE_180_length_15790_cov_0.586706:2943-2644(-)